jgi:hypothetical protein
MNEKLKEINIFAEFKTLIRLSKRDLRIKNMRVCLEKRRLALESINLKNNEIGSSSWKHFLETLFDKDK